MSEPYIKLYASDMRADPKVRNLSAEMRYALIQAWDLAKNGPGDVAELRSNDGRAMRERELRELASVSPSATRRMFERWASGGLCELDEEDGDVLCVFPTLAKRQGIDRTNAERQRRFREKQRNARRNARSNAKVTPPRNGDVTGENQSTEKRRAKEEKPSVPATPPPPSRARDLVWDAVVEAVGYEPETKSERGKFNRAVKDLRDAGADPDEIRRRAKAMKQAWPNIRLSPTTLSGNWSAFGTHANGAAPKRSQAEVDRLAAEHGWNGADVQPVPDDELERPF